MLSHDCFDIFDTILFRALGSPQSVHLCLGRRLQSQGHIRASAEVFARARAEAERRAYANHGGLDACVYIEDIYRELEWSLALDAETSKICLETELEIERLLVRHPLRSAAILNSSVEREQVLGFISDMYLNSTQLRSLLDQAGIDHAGHRLFVSSELGSSKKSGRLFELIKGKFDNQQQESSFKHVGNDKHSDVYSARICGWDAVHFEEGNLNVYETALEKHTWQTGGLSSAFAGAARLVRLSYTDDNAIER